MFISKQNYQMPNLVLMAVKAALCDNTVLLAVCAVDCNYLMSALHLYKWASV